MPFFSWLKKWLMFFVSTKQEKSEKSEASPTAIEDFCAVCKRPWQWQDAYASRGRNIICTKECWKLYKEQYIDPLYRDELAKIAKQQAAKQQLPV